MTHFKWNSPACDRLLRIMAHLRDPVSGCEWDRAQDFETIVPYTIEEAYEVADAIAHSPLVKTAFFASDPNWGRILAAVGRAGLSELALEHVAIDLGEVGVVRGGGLDPAYREADGQRVMARTDITITVRLGRGDAGVRIWTCDLGHEYVRINAEYRT